MNESIFFNSESGNSYLLDSKNNQIQSVHPLLEIYYDKDKRGRLNSPVESMAYTDLEKRNYLKQYKDFKEGGLFVKELPKINTSLGADNITNKLANLRQVLFEVTDRCNLNCYYCGYGKLYGNYDTRDNKHLNLADAIGLIDYLWEYWESDLNISFNNSITLGFYGGEPLLNMALIKQVIAYIESKNTINLKFAYNMTTNAVLLNRYMDYLKEKDFSILISLDGDEYAHSYRTTHNGENSFGIVMRNIELLREKHPEFYKSNIDINSVIHNRNSVESILKFVKKKLDKTPSTSDLNTNGINSDKKDEFWKMFNDKFLSMRQAANCESIKEDMFIDDPETTLVDYFINGYTGNTYWGYNDLFVEKKDLEFIPTGTCYPFQKKIFLTVNGKILPCERIGQEQALGRVKNGVVNLNVEEISNKYKVFYEELSSQCKSCYDWKSCGQCLYFLENKNGKLYCDRFVDKNSYKDYLKTNVSILEREPEKYEKVIDEIVIDNQ